MTCPPQRCRACFGALILALSGVAHAQSWVPQGPAPNTRGQVRTTPDREVSGAIHALALHPTDADIAYVGAVNGGGWMTSNARAASPDWTPLTDGHPSLAIGALEFDPTDNTHRTLVAGTGRFSSFLRRGGRRVGQLRTPDAGTNWTLIGGGGALQGLNISGVAARGAVLVVSADAGAQPGVHRSIDGGGTWTPVSGAATSGLPAGAAFDLAGDPSDPARLFTNAGGAIYRSPDTGEHWNQVGSTAMNALLGPATSNVELAVGRANNVYVAIVNSIAGDHRLAGCFRSGDGGTTWQQLDLPTTNERGTLVGIHPGGQGGIHLSIAADPVDANVVYIGGDRQPSQRASTGARDFTGRLFRGDASQPSGSQWVHLTDSSSMGAAGGGTASNTAPHADSRDMAVDAANELVEVDDGGVYRRTQPRSNAGDWRSMNGDLQVTELHSVAWDAVSDVIIGGAQDTGTPEQRAPAGPRWRSVSTADGGVVAVADVGTPGESTRYSSWQELGGFRRRYFDATNTLQGSDIPALTPLGLGVPRPAPQFYTPLAAHATDSDRLIIGAANGVYESDDQGDTVRLLSTVRVNQFHGRPIAYGATGNAEILYVGAGRRVLVRAATGAPLAVATAYPGGGNVHGLTLDPAAARSAFVVDTSNVFRTTDAGATWTNVTGNLAAAGAGTLRAVAFVPAGVTTGSLAAVVVGGDGGAFRAPGPTFSAWTRLGTALGAVPVYSLEYDAADLLLLAGTLGRGAWTLRFVTPPPVAGFSASPTRGRAPLTVVFSNGSTGAVTAWAWDFGDHSPANTLPSPTHVYSRKGTYDVSLTVTGPGGSDSVTRQRLVTATGGCATVDPNGGPSAWLALLLLAGIAARRRSRG